MSADFPPVHLANSEGLLAIGGEANAQTLTQAYLKGIFPWPVSEDFPLTWFAPDPRGVLELDNFRLPRSLKKFLNKKTYSIKFNRDFQEIIQRCAKIKRKHEEGTWINQEIIDGYIQMFSEQKAYCVGAYDEKEELVGGLYGVCLGEIISGESMFYQQPNASKAALAALVSKLQSKGIPFLDTQMVTPVIASMGGEEVARKEFMKMLGHLNSTRPRSEIFD